MSWNRTREREPPELARQSPGPSLARSRQTIRDRPPTCDRSQRRGGVVRLGQLADALAGATGMPRPCPIKGLDWQRPLKREIDRKGLSGRLATQCRADDLTKITPCGKSVPPPSRAQSRDNSVTAFPLPHPLKSETAPLWSGDPARLLSVRQHQPLHRKEKESIDDPYAQARRRTRRTHQGI